jgi:hypothetical protein
MGIFTCGPNGGCQLQVFNPNSPAPSGGDYDSICSGMQGTLVGSFACIDTSGGNACNSSTTQAVCIDKNMCYGITYNGSDSSGVTPFPTTTIGGNQVCAPGGTGQCAIRDASAYIASKCDGQQTCALSTADCGPLPCSNIPVDNCNFDLSSPLSGEADFTGERVDRGFCSLPFAYGYPGGPALGIQQFNNTPASVSLGYQIHGLYTCIPES